MDEASRVDSAKTIQGEVLRGKLSACGMIKVDIDKAMSHPRSFFTAMQCLSLTSISGTQCGFEAAVLRPFLG